MTRPLDIMSTILSEVSGLPSDHFRQAMLDGIESRGFIAPDTELLRELTPEEEAQANQLLRSPSSLKGARLMLSMAGISDRLMTPAQRQRMAMFADNLQN